MEQMLKDFGGLGGIMGQHKMLDEFPSRFQELPDSGNQTDRDLMLKPESGKLYSFSLVIYRIVL